jgi:hypothetical protein
MRELGVWRWTFPNYVCDLVPVAEARADVRAWSKVTKTGKSYYPE